MNHEQSKEIKMMDHRMKILLILPLLYAGSILLIGLPLYERLLKLESVVESVVRVQNHYERRQSGDTVALPSSTHSNVHALHYTWPSSPHSDSHALHYTVDGSVREEPASMSTDFDVRKDRDDFTGIVAKRNLQGSKANESNNQIDDDGKPLQPVTSPTTSSTATSNKPTYQFYYHDLTAPVSAPSSMNDSSNGDNLPTVVSPSQSPPSWPTAVDNSGGNDPTPPPTSSYLRSVGQDDYTVGGMTPSSGSSSSNNDNNAPTNMISNKEANTDNTAMNQNNSTEDESMSFMKAVMIGSFSTVAVAIVVFLSAMEYRQHNGQDDAAADTTTNKDDGDPSTNDNIAVLRNLMIDGANDDELVVDTFDDSDSNNENNSIYDNTDNKAVPFLQLVV